eukprot:2849495-Alexandrium_andersonii.AAC.1
MDSWLIVAAHGQHRRGESPAIQPGMGGRQPPRQAQEASTKGSVCLCGTGNGLRTLPGSRPIPRPVSYTHLTLPTICSV